MPTWLLFTHRFVQLHDLPRRFFVSERLYESSCLHERDVLDSRNAWLLNLPSEFLLRYTERIASTLQHFSRLFLTAGEPEMPIVSSRVTMLS